MLNHFLHGFILFFFFHATCFVCFMFVVAVLTGCQELTPVFALSSFMPHPEGGATLLFTLVIELRAASSQKILSQNPYSNSGWVLDAGYTVF